MIADRAVDVLAVVDEDLVEAVAEVDLAVGVNGKFPPMNLEINSLRKFSLSTGRPKW
jgi:hypothetical protein